MKPFSEVSLFEQTSSDPFYATGSSLTIGDGGTFVKSLSNKKQIKVTFSVDKKVAMLANTSSMYYYDKSARQWTLPHNIIKSKIDSFSGAFDSSHFSFPAPSTERPNLGSGFTEDSVGFDAYGRSVAAGTSDPCFLSPYTYSHVNSSLNGLEYFSIAYDNIAVEDNAVFEKFGDLMTGEYAGSAQISSKFSPTEDEVFDLKIDQPFLIEKVVVQIPFCFGSSWFSDRTASVNGFYRDCDYSGPIPDLLVNNYWDCGGPALTVSLFCKKKYGRGAVLDLVTSGTITHRADTVKTIDVRKMTTSSSPDVNWNAILITPVGLGSSSAVVDPIAVSPGSWQFTGSVSAKMTCAVSNGVEMLYTKIGQWNDYTPPTLSNYKSFHEKLFTYPAKLDDPAGVSSKLYSLPVSVDSFGRAMTGFAPSGGSIFGGEYVTGKSSEVTDKQNKIFYIQNSGTVAEAESRAYVIDKFNRLADAFYSSYSIKADSWRTSRISVTGQKDSPYLISPGEELVLAISKTRPAVSGASFKFKSAENAAIGRGILTAHYPFTGSYLTNGHSPLGAQYDGHDVQLNTGSINITLYGSYVRENKEYVP
jgi:uncharacterized cupredoxin-like copper-binding protein